MKKQLKYLDPKSQITLRQGVVELRKAEGFDGDAAESLAPELTGDIDSHDAIHVLFACPTSLAGEIVAHVWTAFGTSVSVHDMHRVNRHDDHKAVLAQIGHRKLIRVWARSIPRILRTIINAKRMKAKFPVEDLKSFEDTPLVQLREQFGIKLVLVDRNQGKPRGGGAALRSIRRKQEAEQVGAGDAVEAV